MELTQDDIAILQIVYRHRFVQADYLYRLFAGRSSDRLSRRLTLLFRNEFLDRPLAQIDRYQEGGSKPLVYGLGNAGARYLKEALGTPIGKTDWRSRNRTYTRESLDHTLAVSRFLIDLEIACRSRPELTLIRFEDILAKAPEATRRSRNPGTWSVAIQWHGGRSVVSIAPDAIFGLRARASGGDVRVAYFFLEIDRGTMTIVPSERVRESEAFPYRATILRKLYAYADSYRQALHGTQFGLPTARILILTTGEARTEAIRRASQGLVVQPLRLPAGLFLFGTYGNSHDPLEVTLRNASGQIQRLLE